MIVCQSGRQWSLSGGQEVSPLKGERRRNSGLHMATTQAVHVSAVAAHVFPQTASMSASNSPLL